MNEWKQTTFILVPALIMIVSTDGFLLFHLSRSSDSQESIDHPNCYGSEALMDVNAYIHTHLFTEMLCI